MKTFILLLFACFPYFGISESESLSHSALWEDKGMQADTKLKPFLQALWLVIMPYEWSSGPLIGHQALWLVIIPSDWSSCLLIDHQGIGDLDSGLTINLQFKLQIIFFWF